MLGRISSLLFYQHVVLLRGAAQVLQWVTYILDHQTAEGWLGPDDGFGGVGNAYWSGWNAAAALLQYGEGSDALIAKRCRRAVLDYVRASYKRMLVEPTTSWSQNRWQDWVLIIHTLMDQVGWKRQYREDEGFDWDGSFLNFMILSY